MSLRLLVSHLLETAGEFRQDSLEGTSIPLVPRPYLDEIFLEERSRAQVPGEPASPATRFLFPRPDILGLYGPRRS